MSESDRVEPLVTVRPGALPKLEYGEVQVFRLWARGGAEQVSFAMQVLSPEERARAGRYRVEGAREEFVVGRSALRILLGAVLGVTPNRVELETNRYGKPTTRGVEFNVSHSRGLICIALCRDAAVGLDVEWIEPGLEVMELAEPNFTAEETGRLASLPAGRERAAAFCRLWTQKEAVAKADGRGLRIPLRDIVVPEMLPGLANAPRDTDVDTVVTGQGLPEGSMTYRVFELEAAAGYAGAFSVGDSNSPIVCRFFSLDLERSGVS